MEIGRKELISQMARDLRKSEKEVEKTINKLIKLKLIEEFTEEELNENDTHNQKQYRD